jgi:serine/threonine protein kinase
MDVHVTRAPYFLVMELLAGESLRQRLRREYRLDLHTVTWIGRQTAEAMAALHRAGFVHGDVKPDNIRLTGPATATLIDLGFAHRPGENARLGLRGYVLGTVSYLPPELCISEEVSDVRSDVFSLGVTLFELLSGQLPYATGSMEQTLRRRVFDEPLEIRSLNPDTPAAFAKLVQRMLRRESHERPRAAAVAHQLLGLEIATLGRRQTA